MKVNNIKITILLTIFAIIPFIIAIILGLNALMISHYKPIVVKPVLKINSKNLICVEIAPLQDKSRNNLVNKSIKFIDKNFLNKICESLNKAKEYDPNHPISIWSCIIILHTNKEAYSFVVHKTKKNELILSFFSDIDSGLHLGWYRSDLLGMFIERQLGEVSSK